MKVCKLSDIAEVQTGPFGSQLHSEDYVEEGTPIVTVEHLGNRRFTIQNLPFVSNEDRERLSKYSLREGDIVFSRVGAVDRCSYVTSDENGWLFSGRCLRVRCHHECDALYLYYYFCSDSVKEYVRSKAVGATMLSLNTDLMLEIPIQFPQIKLQKEIAKTLSFLDSKIELNRQINDNLEAMAKQLYDYWFVQFDFPNEEGKPYKSSGGAMVWNEKLKREIPTSFDVKSLSEIIEVKDGTHDSPKPQDNGYFLLTSKHLTERGLDYASAYKISKEDYESINKRSKVDTNDILFSMIGTIGNSYFVEETNINFAIKNMALFKTSAKRWFSEYLYLYLSSCDYKHYEGNSLSGSIQKFVSLRTLRDMPILYHEDIIKVFAKEVRNIITIMVNLRKENIELTKQRDELLPLLMNGQASVNYHLSVLFITKIMLYYKETNINFRYERNNNTKRFRWNESGSVS